MDSPLQDIIEYYDQTDWDYRKVWDDSKYPAMHFGMYDEENTNHNSALINTNVELSNICNIQTGDKVLDAGCGRGGTVFWLAEQKEAIATGVNIVESQIQFCLEKKAKFKYPNRVHFLKADFHKIPLPDASFDCVWACESLCHSSNKTKFYQEAYRLLRPGGRLIVSEYCRNSRSFTKEDEVLIRDWLSNWVIPDIDTVDEHKNNALEAGFDTCHVYDYTDKVRVSLRNLNEQSRRWAWLGETLDSLKLRKRHQLNNLRAGYLQYEAFQKGLWSYRVINAIKRKS